MAAVVAAEVVVAVMMKFRDRRELSSSVSHKEPPIPSR